MAWIQMQFRSSISKIPTAVAAVIPERRQQTLPVLYLLHDLGQNQSYWIRNTRVEALANQYQVAVIMPQGLNTFYVDTKNQRAVHSFLTQELTELSAFWFGVELSPERTAIAGRGMGGFGAAYAFLHHPERFGMAGVLDLKNPTVYYENPTLAERDGVNPKWIWGEKSEWESLHFWEEFEQAKQGGNVVEGRNEESEDIFLERLLRTLHARAVGKEDTADKADAAGKEDGVGKADTGDKDGQKGGNV